MTMNDRIPLVDELDFSAKLGGGLNAILSEIESMLERLVSTGEESQIDIRSLPLAPFERASLKKLLGNGEAILELQLGGPTLCHETGFPAVWWIEHLNPDGRIAAEFIEVAKTPHILTYEASEIASGNRRLKQLLQADGNNDEEWDNDEEWNNE